MRKYVVCLAVVVFVASLVPLASARPPDIYQYVPPSGPSQAPQAVTQTGDTVCIFYEDFQDGEAGWVAKAMDEQNAYWHRTTLPGEAIWNHSVYDDGGGPRGVWWCGTNDPSFVTPPGYGNNWDESLTKSLTLPTGTVSLEHSIQYDTEEDYDITYIEISTDDGANFTTLESYSGDSEGFVTESVDLSAYAGEDVVLRFRFDSDGNWSDEDGFWMSDGAFRLDWIQVTGHPLDDFEAGGDGWVGDGSTRGVMWCGTEGTPYWATPPGYGNDWYQYLTKSFTLPTGTVVLDYSMQYGTEAGYDWVNVEISTDGGVNYNNLDSYSGTSVGFETLSSDLSAYASQDVILRFAVTSDNAWSDEDGFWDTDGACRLDWVQVTGHPVDNFEIDQSGWVAAVPGPPPVSFRLEQTPSCMDTAPCDDYCFTWVGYDPETGVFPFPPPGYLNDHNDLWFGIESPVITIPNDAETYLLVFDVYMVLPLENCVFYTIEIAAPPPEEGGTWRDYSYVYFQGSDPPHPYDFHRFTYDLINGREGFPPLIPEGETRMKVRIAARDMAPYWAGEHCDAEPEHSVSPFFDNITILAVGTTDPGIDCTGFPRCCDAEGTVAGRVTADCPVPGTGLLGVTVDAYAVGGGELAGSAVTDENGDYTIESLLEGDYTITIVTPLSYDVVDDEIELGVPRCGIIAADFDLTCKDITPTQRSKGFWKHQVGVALGGKGHAHIDGPTLCGYLDLIEVHFNSNAVNQVVVYNPPPSGECNDKLEVAKDLLNLKGKKPMIDKARQQFMALLLNVSSEKLSLQEIISEDGATVSQAITYCDHVIDDPAGDHEQAKDICDWINNAAMVPAGVIPLDTDNIAYSPKPELPVPEKFALGQNYPNPFNPSTVIGYDVPADAGAITLRVYDVGGRLVRTLVEGMLNPGNKTVTWYGKDDSGRHVSTGIYFYQLKAKGYSETRKMLLMK